MANNFYLNDPLLFQTPYSRGVESEEDIKRQFTDFMTKYNSRQSQQQSRDYVGELEEAVKTITSTSSDSLSANEEYNDLRASLSEMIQYELMQTIRWKINSNASAVKNIERQLELIKESNRASDDEQRRNITEINDYIKNYSNMTFDEYRKMKESGDNQKKKN
jgi:hypothetical protein